MLATRTFTQQFYNFQSIAVNIQLLRDINWQIGDDAGHAIHFSSGSCKVLRSCVLTVINHFFNFFPHVVEHCGSTLRVLKKCMIEKKNVEQKLTSTSRYFVFHKQITFCGR